MEINDFLYMQPKVTEMYREKVRVVFSLIKNANGNNPPPLQRMFNNNPELFYWQVAFDVSNLLITELATILVTDVANKVGPFENTSLVEAQQQSLLLLNASRRMVILAAVECSKEGIEIAKTLETFEATKEEQEKVAIAMSLAKAPIEENSDLH